MWNAYILATCGALFCIGLGVAIGMIAEMASSDFTLFPNRRHRRLTKLEVVTCIVIISSAAINLINVIHNW